MEEKENMKECIVIIKLINGDEIQAIKTTEDIRWMCKDINENKTIWIESGYKTKNIIPARSIVKIEIHDME